MSEKIQKLSAKIVPLEDYSFQVGRSFFRAKIISFTPKGVILEIGVKDKTKEINLNRKAICGIYGGVSFKFKIAELSKYQQIVDIELEAKM
jgi:hypothetical protein